MPTPAATGAQAYFAWRRERAFGVPGTETRVFLRPIPPATIGLLHNEAASPEINPTGFRAQGVPSGVTGPLDLAMSLTASTILEPLENIFGKCVKSTLEAGVFQYVFTPNRTLPIQQSLDAVFGYPPVSRGLGYGIKLSQIAMTIGNNALIPSRMAGFVSHGTRLMEASAGGTNTGTYPGPVLRGPLSNPRDGEKLQIKITRDAVSGLQYKAERYPTGATPTFLGAAIDAAYDSTGQGTWQNLAVSYQLTGTLSVTAGGTAVTGVGTKFLTELRVGKPLTIGAQAIAVSAIADDTHATLGAVHTLVATAAIGYILNEDAGYTNENRDPLDILWPGDATAHGLGDANDTFTYNTTWTDPTATYIDGQRYTSAHLVNVKYGEMGASALSLTETRVLTANPTLAWPVSPEVGNGSQYVFALDRDSEFTPTIAATRRWRDPFFEQFAEQHKRFQLVATLEGQKLGTNTYRESIAFAFPKCGIASRTAPLANPQAIVETLNFVVEDPGGVTPACTVTVITTRDWVPLN